MLWHWLTDVKKFKKENPKGFRLWRLEYLINYGVQKGEKLSKKEVIKYWDKMKPPHRKNQWGFLYGGSASFLPLFVPPEKGGVLSGAK